MLGHYLLNFHSSPPKCALLEKAMLAETRQTPGTIAKGLT